MGTNSCLSPTFVFSLTLCFQPCEESTRITELKNRIRVHSRVSFSDATLVFHRLIPAPSSKVSKSITHGLQPRIAIRLDDRNGIVLLTWERNRWTSSHSSNGTWKPLLRHGWMASESGGLRRVSLVASPLRVVSVSLGRTKSTSAAATSTLRCCGNIMINFVLKAI